MKFSFSDVRLVDVTKKKSWVTYKIEFDEPFSYKEGTVPKRVHYPKIYGGEYQIRLGSAKTLKERKILGEDLLALVLEDLQEGKDPKRKTEIEVAKIAVEKEKTNNVSYDSAIENMIKYHRWDNPSETQELTAVNAINFFNNQFRLYVTEINKLDDITKITKDDIVFYIARHNNPQGKVYLYPVDGKTYKIRTWTISTCISKIQTINYIFMPLVDKNIIPISPTVGISNLRKKLKRTATQKIFVKRHQIWTEEELVEFHIKGNTDENRLFYNVGLCCYHAFIRRSEILRMRLGMVDLQNKRFVIPSSITKSDRKYDTVVHIYLKFNQKLHDALELYINQQFGKDLNPEYRLFPAPEGNNIKYTYEEFRKDNRSSLFKHLDSSKTPYSLKHTGVTEYWNRQIDKGIHPNVIISKLMKKCRHSNTNETIKYLELELGLDVASKYEDDEDDE